jgi:hypothetical protein
MFCKGLRYFYDFRHMKSTRGVMYHSLQKHKNPVFPHWSNKDVEYKFAPAKVRAGNPARSNPGRSACSSRYKGCSKNDVPDDEEHDVAKEWRGRRFLGDMTENDAELR